VPLDQEKLIEPKPSERDMDPAALRLPDRSHVGPGLRGALFLFRQPFMLWPGLLATAACIAGVGLLGVRAPSGPVGATVMLGLMTPLIGFGFAALTGLPGFMLYRALATRAPELCLDAGEQALLTARANHFLGDEGRGGRVSVTNSRVVFVPHRFNVQLAGCAVALDDVTSAKWRTILGPGGSPLSSVVELETTGGTEVFVVDRAEHVATFVDALRRMASTTRASAGGALARSLGLV
jgi:hypothetical protein